MSADLDLGDYDLFDSDIQQCPFPWFAMMRRDEPVFQVNLAGRPVWLVTTYDDCVGVVMDPATFSSRFGSPGLPPSPALSARLKAVRAEHGAHRFVPTLLTADPPQHTRYRKLVARAFSPRTVAAQEGPMRSLVRSLLAEWPANGEVEYVSTFAVPFPVRVIAQALNVAASDLDDFKRWSDDTMAAQGSHISDDERVAAELGTIELQKYFLDQIAMRRASPQDDILTHLVEATLDPAEVEGAEALRLTDAEILSILHQLLVAGNETTTKALAEMMLLLGRNPDTWSAVKSSSDAIRPIVEEALRLGAPGLAMWRIATRDTELHGVSIPAGGRVLVVFGSANRDTSEFASGDEFCPANASASHLTFGKGPHFCLGASLARLEMAVALEETCAHVDSFALAPTNRYPYVPSFMLRGLEELHLVVRSNRTAAS